MNKIYYIYIYSILKITYKRHNGEQHETGNWKEESTLSMEVNKHESDIGW